MWKRYASPLLLCATVAISATGYAQTFPSRPMTWIVPYSPGGATDNIARLLSNEMKTDLNTTIVVDYKPGAATIVGSDVLLRSNSDGHTLMSADNATLAYNEHIYDKLPYDPAKFTYIGGIGQFPMALAVHPSVPVDNVKEFIDYAKKNSDKVFYGSVGLGSPHHLNMEYFLDRIDLNITHVPYRGGAPAVQALIAGDVQAMFVDLVLGLELMKAGKIKPIVLAADKRVSALPDVPTMQEEGIQDMELTAWQGVVGPAGMDPAIVQRLNTSLNQALQSKEFDIQFGRFAFEVKPGTPQEFQQYVKAENQKWGEFIRRKQISANTN